jgi:2-keto-3-deoxy-L-rhamnonate aldolase RhmA
MRERQDCLDITTCPVAMLQIQPDAVKTKVSRVFDECRDKMPQTAHADRFVVFQTGQSLAFSHRYLKRRCESVVAERNETVRMCCLGHFIPAFVKHAAHFGFDCIWLDLEHRNWTGRDVQAILAFSHLYDIDVMVRPSTLEKSKLYRYLEDGAAGLMIPLVSDAEKARNLVNAVKFPPLGDRGIDGAGLDLGFMVDFQEQENFDYTNLVNQETFLVVQIETPAAVENIEEIASVKGVDALFIGIGDLGLRYKHVENPNTLDEVDVIISQAAKNMVSIGGALSVTRMTPKELWSWVARSFHLLEILD